MDEQKIINFYKTWIEKVPQLSEGYIFDENKNLLPKRYIFSWFQDIIEKFLNNSLEDHKKIIILPGIRGVGKTTLLMQIFGMEKFLEKEDINILSNIGKIQDRLYLDVSKLKLEGISLNDFFKFYERIRKINLEKLSHKFILLLDEVHYDDKWGLFLKNIFDRTKGHKNILIIATGSSAISLKMNPDLSRRSTIVEMYPMKYNEYSLLKYGKPTFNGFSETLQEIILYSPSATQVFKKLKEKSGQIEQITLGFPLHAEKDFFTTGGFPFALKIGNQVEATERIKDIISNIILKDIITLRRFTTETLSKISDLLYLIANSDIISYEKLRDALKIEESRTLYALIESLITSGILVKVKSYGTTHGSTRKTPKLLFVSPSLRTAILDNNFLSGIEGKKLEDYFTLLYQKELKGKVATDLSYDIAQGGADFILRLKDKSKIVIEVGFSKEDVQQVIKTQKKVKGKYGIVFGSENLELVNDSIVKIPLSYLLLM